jgi:hypothetical protein
MTAIGAKPTSRRPRKTLDFATPEEHFTRLLAGLASKQTKPSGGVRSGTCNPPSLSLEARRRVIAFAKLLLEQPRSLPL